MKANLIGPALVVLFPFILWGLSAVIENRDLRVFSFLAMGLAPGFVVVGFILMFIVHVKNQKEEEQE
ncbi:hypothetical protein D3C87_566410 [compost metagenome]